MICCLKAHLVEKRVGGGMFRFSCPEMMISRNAAAWRREQECVSGEPAKLRQSGVEKKKRAEMTSAMKTAWLTARLSLRVPAWLAGWLAAPLVEITPGYNNTRPHVPYRARDSLRDARFRAGASHVLPCSARTCTRSRLRSGWGRKEEAMSGGGGGGRSWSRRAGTLSIHRSLWAGCCSAA